MSSIRVPCDQCRQRRIRCDGHTPCASCLRTHLSCRRKYIRKRRGRKEGDGKQIAALRATEISDVQGFIVNCKEAGDILSSEDLPDLMKRCVGAYLEHMYPVMPLLKRSTLSDWFDRPLLANEHSMLFALCALVTTFMCGRSESIVGSVEWQSVARLFVRKSLLMRLEYDFIDDSTVLTLLSSFFLSVTFFELHNIRQCWFYLREAINLAQILGLHTNEFYQDMDDVDALFCRRIYDILFVTERSFAISRHKPVLLSHPLPPPAKMSRGEQEEGSEINPGFRQLVQVYSQLDVDFLHNWSQEGLVCSSFSRENRELDLVPDCDFILNTQKADIFVTQHWLDLTFWRAALQQGLLSTSAKSRSRTFSYPEDISLSLLLVLSSLPTESVEVHGLGIVSNMMYFSCSN
ncbi:hypothetical protein BGW36DRAFT_361454 [Talaromyces proteolyticus]|uniref:Zn(2)-C6 fungal-type domain-containing protein n=1 Tax=Talaromyces proteolyticus TaxID=1131652 RepID=A0AAD4KJ70_9EURO|nr:uncharacterized protein BGW36DRAFT_361454 [Talaromyces proteolyticus]KAH8693601.1 hypothetical protein BGW36DRAFT_361454 [Talaromyces proteolyticus]